MEIEVPKKIKISRTFVSVVVVIVVAVVSFYGGTRYQKSRQPAAVVNKTAAAAGGFGGGFGGRFGGGGARRGIAGTVTAVSSTSITITGTADNASHTYSISSTTTVTNNGQSAAVSDIQSGNTVLVIANPSDTSQAARILINPSFGGGAPMPTSNQQD